MSTSLIKWWLPSPIKSPRFSSVWLPTPKGSFPVLRSLKRLPARSFNDHFLPRTSPRPKSRIIRELPCDPAILLLGLHLKETKTLTQKDTCTPMFTVALFTTAKTWKQSKCPKRWLDKEDERVRMRVYIHTYTHINTQWNAFQKEWKFATCSNMDELRGYYA